MPAPAAVAVLRHPIGRIPYEENFVRSCRHAGTGPGDTGGAGGGASSQLSGELFNQMTGAKLVHIPYKGAGFALTALVGGETQAAFLSTTTISSQSKSGRIKALAVLSKKRFEAAPDIPSIVEAGYPGIES